MNKGFTLVELLVVVLIIGVLSAIALPQYTTAVERSRSVEALSLLSSISDSAQRYYIQHGEWPLDDDNNPIWGVLDIDVPVATSGGETYRGGKNFKLNMAPHGSDRDSFVVSAERIGIDDKYFLIFSLYDDTDTDTITVTRSCSKVYNEYAELTEGSKALTYCNAITGGENESF